MRILTAAEMQACDRVTTERFGVASIDLMRNAAGAVAEFVESQFPNAHKITVLCGRGNNGGDGLMTAHLLAEAGREVTVLMLGDPDGLTGDAAQAWQELTREAYESRASIHRLSSAEDFAARADSLAADLIVDAVVGTGFQPPLRGLAMAALEWLRSVPHLPPILAVDLPSGWDADSTDAAQANAFPADAVVTFTAPKSAHVFGLLTRSIRQPIVVASIGSPEEAVFSELRLHWAGSAKSMTDGERPADSNKGMYGHVLVVGGSPGKSGAPAMASLSALRTGAGLVTAAVTPSVLALVAGVAPELMTRALATTPRGEISAENLAPENLKSLLKGMTVLAVGPGLGTTEEAAEFVPDLLMQSRLPTVVDADGLNILAKDPARLPQFAEGRTLVFTPHPGEMARLTGKTIAEVQADRIGIAREFATRNQVILVLKGWRTLIAHPDGRIAVNTTGNPGMAKGGSGDLLTGMVAAMLAQFPDDPGEAVEAAVYLHGLAADITVSQPGIGGDQHTLLATDSLEFLHRAFQFHPVRYRKNGESGYCWLQGLPADLQSARCGAKERHEQNGREQERIEDAGV